MPPCRPESVQKPMTPEEREAYEKKYASLNWNDGSKSSVVETNSTSTRKVYRAAS